MGALGDPIAGVGAWSSAVAVAMLGGRPVLVSGHTSVCVRDLGTGELLHEPAECASMVQLLRVARWQGRDVAITMHMNNSVHVWDIGTGDHIHGPMTEWAGTIALLPHKDTVLAVIEDHPVEESGRDYDFDETALHVWDFFEGTKICPPLVGGGFGSGVLYPPMELVSMHAGPALVSSAGGDGLVRVWDLATGTGDPLEPGDGGDDYVTALKTFVVDGRAMAIAGSQQGRIQAWDLVTGAFVGERIAAHSGRICGLAIIEVDGMTLGITAGSDPALRVWELGTGSPSAISV